MITDSLKGQPSRNKLIAFEDGTYIELFNWVERPDEPHEWADKKPGIIDFALTSMPPSTSQSLHEGITARLQPHAGGTAVDLMYEPPEAGGRVRIDGVEVKWTLTKPMRNFASSTPPRPLQNAHGYHQIFPFFTHDITDRNVRVLFDDNGKTTHPCGATGFSSVEVLFPEPVYARYLALYEKVLDVPAKAVSGVSDKPSHELVVKPPVQGSNQSRILTRAKPHAGGYVWLQNSGAGIRGLRLAVKGRHGHGVRALGSEGIASTLFLEW